MINVEQPLDSQNIVKKSAGNNYISILLTLIFSFLIFGLGGFYLGRNYKVTKIVQEEIVPEVPEVIDCTKNFYDEYLGLKFDYDSCVWNINVNIKKESPYLENYGLITATHRSGRQVEMRINSMGSGGGYPECYMVDELVQFGDEMVRVHNVKTVNGEFSGNYRYISSDGDFAIKGVSGKHGDLAFKEYFTFMNPNYFKDTNMCWRDSGGVILSVIDRGVMYAQIEKMDVVDKDFLEAADKLVESAYLSAK